MKIKTVTFGAATAILLALSAAHAHDHAQDHAPNHAPDHAHAQGAHAATGKDASVTLGDLTLSHAYTRAMPPNAPVAGGYLSVTNAGAQDDRLVAATSTSAAEVQIHEMTMNGSVMKMRKLPDGLPIPAARTVELKPGGYHLMFIGVTDPFVEGQSVPLTLTFEKAGDVTLNLPVTAMRSQATDGIEAGGHSGH